MTEKDEETHIPNVQKKKKSTDVRVGDRMSNSASDMKTNGSEKDTISDGSMSIAEDPTESSEIYLSIYTFLAK
ncbi:hypothetical protein V6N11_042950 [Hibiscus sabdariffa]|uniref:Uncharacterized protein n=1 Tax=Hibiscus sabdariffa TaxID=183260 RepID=A0ABR2QXU4_9ROSI